MSVSCGKLSILLFFYSEVIFRHLWIYHETWLHGDFKSPNENKQKKKFDLDQVSSYKKTLYMDT